MEPAVSGRAEAVEGDAAVSTWTTTKTSADYAPAVRSEHRLGTLRRDT